MSLKKQFNLVLLIWILATKFCLQRISILLRGSLIKMPPSTVVIKRKKLNTGAPSTSTASGSPSILSQPTLKQFLSPPSSSSSSSATTSGEPSSHGLGSPPVSQSNALTPDQKKFLENISTSRSNWGSAQVFPFKNERVRTLTIGSSASKKGSGECVVYWMSRDCRVQGSFCLVLPF